LRYKDFIVAVRKLLPSWTNIFQFFGWEAKRNHETNQKKYCMSRKETQSWLNCAAVHVRMSTEHQQYSISNQMDVIREYAKRRELGIVKECSDEGKSGLNI
jgi:hypothetical protein